MVQTVSQNLTAMVPTDSQNVPAMVPTVSQNVTGMGYVFSLAYWPAQPKAHHEIIVLLVPVQVTRY